MNKNITFYNEWLKLDKKYFRLLAMIADLEGFEGNLSDIRKYFSLTKAPKNTEAVIAELAKQNLIEYEKSDKKIIMNLIPQQKSITIPRKWYEKIINYKSKNKNWAVSWIYVLKVMLYLNNYYRSGSIIKRDDIVEIVGGSKEQVSSATSVLQDEHRIISKDVLKEENEYYDEDEKHLESSFYTEGTEYCIPCLWGDPPPIPPKKSKED